MTSKAITEIKDARLKYQGALSSGFQVNKKREEYINVLFNNADALLEALDKHDEQYAKLMEENMKLQNQIRSKKAPPAEEKSKE